MENCQKYFTKSTSNRLLKSPKFKTGWIINLLFIDIKNYKYQDVWLAETSGMQILCAGILHERRGMCVFTWSWFNPAVHWFCTGKSYEQNSLRKIGLNLPRTNTKIFLKLPTIIWINFNICSFSLRENVNFLVKDLLLWRFKMFSQVPGFVDAYYQDYVGDDTVHFGDGFSQTASDYGGPDSTLDSAEGFVRKVI